MKLDLLPLVLSNSTTKQAPLEFIEPCVYLYQFKNVTNSNEIIQKIKTSNFPDCCCLDASTITSLFHIQIACSKAFINKSTERMITRSIYSEIIHAFNSEKNISNSFKKYGIGSETSNVLVIALTECLDLLLPEIDGNLVEIDIPEFYKEESIAAIALQGH